MELSNLQPTSWVSWASEKLRWGGLGRVVRQAASMLRGFEKNVFILEGTKSAGFSGCGYGGSSEERLAMESGPFSLTAEVKCVPGEQILVSSRDLVVPA
eukprot:s4143_g1.t1